MPLPHAQLQAQSTHQVSHWITYVLEIRESRSHCFARQGSLGIEGLAELSPTCIQSR